MTKVEILDLFTGYTRIYKYKYDTFDDGSSCVGFQWSEHNYSCDCNRHLAFPHDGRDNCVTERYVVIGIDPFPKGYTIWDFNKGYPQLGQILAKNFKSLTAEQVMLYITQLRHERETE